VNKPIASRDAALATRHPDLHRCAGALFLALLGLLIATYGYNIPAAAQSRTAAPQPAPTPAPTPATIPGQKPGVKKETSNIVTGTIKGRVVCDDGRPLPNANVIAAQTTNTGAPRATRVDSEGRFAFEEIPAAVYVVFASAPGYIDSTLTMGEPSQWPHHLVGTQIKITMIKGGVITGSLTNPRGEPMVGVPVNATRANGPPAPFMGFLSGGGISESDDRGVYRIYGLPPGQYTVSAGGGSSIRTSLGSSVIFGIKLRTVL